MKRMMGAMLLAATTALTFAGVGCGPSFSDDCVTYCDLAETTCTGDATLFSTRTECFEACEDYNNGGNDGDTDGNTYQCRLTHLQLAKNAPAQHCPHAGPDGAGVCVQVTPRCDTYCAEIQERCTVDSTRQYASVEECESACQTFRQNAPAGSLEGNSVQCRIAYLFQSPDDFTPAQVCESAGQASPQCVDGEE